MEVSGDLQDVQNFAYWKGKLIHTMQASDAQ
jgi:hypothetical protein